MRVADWERRLHDYLVDHAGARFVWGELDCCLFAAGAVEAITGVDPMPEYRGAYDSEETAKSALKTIGKGTLTKTIDANFKRVPVAFVHRGDVVMAGGMLGVCIGADALFVGQEGDREGLVRFPRGDWSRAWKVG